MSRPTVLEHCDGCRRAFGGYDAKRRHRARGRCLSNAELHKRGLERDDEGVWRRTQPQARLAGVAVRGRPRKPKPRIPASVATSGQHKKAEGVPG